jgi:hypothetical protein
MFERAFEAYKQQQKRDLRPKTAAVFTPVPLQSDRLKSRLKKLKLRASNVKLVAQPTAADQPPDKSDNE